MNGLTDEQVAALAAALSVLRERGTPDFMAYERHPLAPGQRQSTCAICGPIPSGIRRQFYTTPEGYWVFCLQCCNSWADALAGDRASRVAQLLQQTAIEVQQTRALRCGGCRWYVPEFKGGWCVHLSMGQLDPSWSCADFQPKEAR